MSARPKTYSTHRGETAGRFAPLDGGSRRGPLTPGKAIRGSAVSAWRNRISRAVWFGWMAKSKGRRERVVSFNRYVDEAEKAAAAEASRAAFKPRGGLSAGLSRIFGRKADS